MSEPFESESDEDDAEQLLHGAATVGDVESVKLLLAHSVDVGAFTDAQGATCLHAAA